MDRKELVGALLKAYRMRKAGRLALARKLISQSDAVSREHGLLMLHRFGLEGFERDIEAALRDPRVSIRIAGCSAAAGLKQSHLVETLLQLAVRDKSARVRLWAIQALKALEDARWRDIASNASLTRLNKYERDDWTLMLEIAHGHRADPFPGSTVDAYALTDLRTGLSRRPVRRV